MSKKQSKLKHCFKFNRMICWTPLNTHMEYPERKTAPPQHVNPPWLNRFFPLFGSCFSTAVCFVVCSAAPLSEPAFRPYALLQRPRSLYNVAPELRIRFLRGGGPKVTSLSWFSVWIADPVRHNQSTLFLSLSDCSRLLFFGWHACALSPSCLLPKKKISAFLLTNRKQWDFETIFALEWCNKALPSTSWQNFSRILFISNFFTFQAHMLIRIGIWASNNGSTQENSKVGFDFTNFKQFLMISGREQPCHQESWLPRSRCIVCRQRMTWEI